MNKKNSSIRSIYEPVVLLCGSTAYFDHQSGCSHRCENCMATVGSVAMPKQCKDLYDMEKIIEMLKGVKYEDTKI